MQYMPARNPEPRPALERSPRPQRGFGATFVAGLYVLLLLGAPLIVRYGPDQEVPVIAFAAAQERGTPRCASAPEFGRSCAGAAEARDPLLD